MTVHNIEDSKKEQVHDKDEGESTTNTTTTTDTTTTTVMINEEEEDDEENIRMEEAIEQASSDAALQQQPQPLSEEKPIIMMTKPKKARTAYFIFQDKHRSTVMANNPGEPVGVIARQIGKLWAQLTVEEKQVYQTQAMAEKEAYAMALQQWTRLTGGAAGAAAAGVESSMKKQQQKRGEGLELPVSKIRKICQLDPDVKGISKEASVLLTKTTELFLEKMGDESRRMALMQNRRTLLLQDLLDVCSMKEAFLFLRDDMQHLSQQSTKTNTNNNTNKYNNKKTTSKPTTNVTPITSFFRVQT